MIQDIKGKYDLYYHNYKIEENDYILAYGKGLVVLQNNHPIIYNNNYNGNLIYGFKIDDRKYFIDLNTYSNGEPIDIFRELPDRNLAFAIVTGYHLYNWYNRTQFCGKCGKKLFHDSNARRMLCSCKEEYYPTISPAVIVGVIDKDKILLTKYKTGYKPYALIAGFAEIGETFEDTVKREVFEEVGVHVKNIRYYKSQPWGLALDILAGYYCDLDGDNTIKLDNNELKEANWFMASDIDLDDDLSSLTREMILNFKNNMVNNHD